ncbi:unnamed protein product [Heligmosomoides polygyrus]|uniref:Reverse transcriptase domain-containing protein n=1 Tax=Heligmosomoides polygyrus TaxID=6339 RepID=A0A183GCP0_HELPZ|nr:unnamed protein product [Heligmosomoides polygyrus]
MVRKMVLNRWRTYFEEVWTIEFAHPSTPSSSPVHGPVQNITVEKVEAALKKMKPVKAKGPDDLAAALWKLKSWYPTKWLATFFNQMIAKKKVPNIQQRSTTIPIWKKKGSPADCTNYRPIRLLSHSMKIFERIVDGRIRDIVQLSTNQCGLPGFGEGL